MNGEFAEDESGNVHYVRNDESSVRIAIDGHPRQGNQYLRLLMLQSFPDIDIPYPLSHDLSSIKKQIDQGLTVFMTLREPLGCITSLISDFLYSPNWLSNSSLDEFRSLVYEEFGNKYIENKFIDYIKMTEFIILNIKNITVVDFETLKNTPEEILAELLGRNLGINRKPLTVNAKEKIYSSSRNEISAYLLSGKFVNILELAKSAHNKALLL
jgi:hypothetical protein